MKFKAHITTALLLILLTACAPQTTEAIPAIPTTTAPTPDSNQVYLDFVTNHQEGIRISLLDACQKQYPELNITDVEAGNPTPYVVNQNPSTFTFKPVVEIRLGDPNSTHYFVEFNDGTLTVKNSDQATVTNPNIIYLVVNEATKLSNGLSRFQATVSIENIVSGPYIKQATCSLQ